jgi:Tol biopolymer transport system component
MIAADKASGTNALWVRPLGATEAHRLDRTEEASFPFWSPDGQFIGFFADWKLKRVGLSGGGVQTICAIPGLAGGSRNSGGGGAWNQDGTIVFGGNGGALLRVPATGGAPQPATALAKGERSHSWPQFLPDGRHFLYLALSEAEPTGAIYVQELGFAQRVQVLQNQTRAMWSPPGYLLFVRETTLFAQHMDPKTFKLDGEPLAVAQDVVANQSRGNRSTFAVSRNGVLAYRSGATFGLTNELTWRDREGKVLAAPGKPGNYHNPSLAPDEKNVALLVGGGPFDTWIMQVSGGVLTRLTGAPDVTIGATLAWSPDSQRLALSGAGGIDVVHLASGKITPLTKEALLVQDWSPDGRSILCTDRSEIQLFLLSMADGAKPQLILDTPYYKRQFRFSPDGKYVAYSSEESGTSEIYIAAFPSFAVKRKASSGGGIYLAWARSGKELFYRAADGTLMDVEVRTDGSIETGIPKPLFKFGNGTLGNGIEVAADGKRFLINEAVKGEEAEKPAITLVLNWAADLKQ